MTDSNIQPPDPSNLNEIPGTDVTFTTPAGLYPEGVECLTQSDGTNINIDTTIGDETYTVDPYASAVDFQVDNMVTSTPDPRIDHVLEHLHNLEAKIDSLHARLDAV